MNSKAYLMVPKKLIVTWLISYFVLLIGIGFSIQWTTYTAQKWCGLVNLFVDAYKETPPTNPTGRNIAAEMVKLQESYDCL